MTALGHGCLVNTMDQTGTAFTSVVAEIARRLAPKPLVLQVPIGTEASFNGLHINALKFAGPELSTRLIFFG